MGMPQRDITTGFLQEFIIDTALHPLAVNELNKMGVTDTLGIQGAKAMLVMAGMNMGAQAFYGGNMMIGHVTLGGPPPDERKLIHVTREPRTLKQVGHNLYALPGDALFEFNEYEIKEQAETELRKVGSLISGNTGYRLSIEGHTDSIGDEGFNMMLSRWRAKAVGAWLVDHQHVKAADVKTMGYGKSRPKVTNVLPNGRDNPDGRAQNRRVEIRFIKK
jgi:outer membrane protein OmpA-like peptidoglycan-associated protein